MSKLIVKLAFVTVLLASVSMFAIDGVVLINQSFVMAAGGFPFKITQPGSYKLSGNLVVPANTDGINILAAGVVLDLNGFSITGPVACTDAGPCAPKPATNTKGINAAPGDITIRNGTVRGFNTGILSGRCLIDEVHVLSNNSFGIIAGRAVIRRSNVSNNGDTGIFASSSVITDNVITSNSVAGVSLLDGSTFGNNVLSGNGSVLPHLDQSSVSQHNNACTDLIGNGGPC